MGPGRRVEVFKVFFLSDTVQQRFLEQIPVVDVFVIMQLKFLQSKSCENVKVPQIQFIVRMLDIPVATESGTRSAKLCRRLARFHRCSSWVVVDASIVVQRLVSGLRQCRKLWKFRSCSSSTRGRSLCDHAATSSSSSTISRRW